MAGETPTNQYTGVSNPPDNGNVSISAPNDGDSTVPQTAAASTPPSNTTPQQTQPNTASNPSQSPNQPQQNPQQQPQQGQNGKQPDLSKPPQKTPAQVASDIKQAQTQAKIQKAGVFHDVAETLAGGPRYNYSVDEYGNMQKTKVPVSNAHLALAIAMEALGGAATAAGEKGTNATGAAARDAFLQGKQQRTEQDQDQRKQASEDFTRRAQVLETNTRMLSNAKNLSNQDAATIDKYIGGWKDTADRIEKEYPGYFKEVVGYDGLKNYNVTEHNAIPYRRVERLDGDGKPVKDQFGNPQWDIDYLIIDPKFKASGFYSPEELKNLQEMGQPAGANELMNETPTGMVLAMNKKSQASNWGVFKNTVGSYQDTVDEANSTGATAKYTAPTTPKLPAKVDSLAEDAANKYSANTGMDNTTFSNFIKGIISQESGGDPNAKSPTGVKGIMQVDKKTGSSYGLSEQDRTNPEKGVDVGTHYFSDLLQKYKNPQLALAAYYSGPGAIDPKGNIVSTSAHSAADTNKYIGDIFKRIGAQSSQADTSDKIARADFAQYAKDNPTFAAASEKFMGALGQTAQENGTVSYTKAIGHLLNSTDPSSTDAGKQMLSFLGGWDNVSKRDQYVETQAEIRKAHIQEQKSQDLISAKTQADEAVQQHKEDMINSLLQTKVPDNVLQMSDQDAISALRDAGVTLPSDALIDAKAIANMDAPLAVASNKRWFKDSKMDQGELLSIVKQFNPAYDTKSFDAMKSQNMSNSPQGKTIDSAAQLANHLNTMLDTVNQYKGDNTGLPLMNKLLMDVGYQTGGTQLTDVQTMANIVTSELGKTLAGGFAPDKEQIDNIIRTMNPANATQQMNSIIGLYVKAMHGKVAPLDDKYNQLSGAADKHLTVPMSLTSLLQKYGQETPWLKPPKPGAQPGFLNGRLVGWKLPDGSKLDASGKPVQQPQPQPPSNPILNFRQ